MISEDEIKKLGELSRIKLDKEEIKNLQKDLEDIPSFVMKDLEFHFVKHVDEVLGLALIRPPFGGTIKRIPHNPPPALA